MCMRRENHEIGTILLDVADNATPVKQLVYYRIRSGMVFNTTTVLPARLAGNTGVFKPSEHAAVEGSLRSYHLP